MSESTPNIGTFNSGDVQAAIDAGRLTSTPHELAVGGYWVIPTVDGVHEVDLTGDRWRGQPKRKAGIIHVQDPDSFTAYWVKHSTSDSEIYANVNNRTVTAVLDAHAAGGDGQPGWQQHRLVYTATHTSAWKAWTELNGQQMTQEQFAEFIEDNRQDIHTPDAATMLEIAQTLEGTTKAAWSSAMRLKDGQRKLAWSEEVDGRAGIGGNLAIPDKLELRLPVFERAAAVDQLTARFRFRIQSGRLNLLYKLDRPSDAVISAFEDVITQVVAATGEVVLRGTPA